MQFCSIGLYGYFGFAMRPDECMNACGTILKYISVVSTAVSGVLRSITIVSILLIVSDLKTWIVICQESNYTFSDKNS